VWLLPSCLSALDTEVLNSPSEQSGLAAEWLVTASGSHTLRPSYWPGWKTRPWSRLLFGAVTSQDFQPPHFSEWTSLPLASPASPGQALGRVWVQPTSDGYGPTSHHFFAEWDQGWSSSKMSLLSSLGEDWNSSLLTWPRSGSMRSGRCYGRATSERPTSESESSSWATPVTPNGGRTLSDEDVIAKGATPKGKRQVDLRNQVRIWPTPVAHDDQKSPEAHLRMKAEMPGGPRSAVTSLTVMAKMWPTARAENGISRNQQAWERPLDEPQNLENAIARWPTPRANDGPGPTAHHRTWSTTDRSLHTVIHEMWSTATALGRQGPDGGPSLPEQVFHQDQTTETPGVSSRPVLNPRFVEMLMGLPSGWALPMPLWTINLERSATE
jgi:hypothetical protein